MDLQVGEASPLSCCSFCCKSNANDGGGDSTAIVRNGGGRAFGSSSGSGSRDGAEGQVGMHAVWNTSGGATSQDDVRVLSGSNS